MSNMLNETEKLKRLSDAIYNTIGMTLGLLHALRKIPKAAPSDDVLQRAFINEMVTSEYRPLDSLAHDLRHWWDASSEAVAALDGSPALQLDQLSPATGPWTVQTRKTLETMRRRWYWTLSQDSPAHAGDEVAVRVVHDIWRVGFPDDWDALYADLYQRWQDVDALWRQGGEDIATETSGEHHGSSGWITVREAAERMINDPELKLIRLDFNKARSRINKARGGANPKIASRRNNDGTVEVNSGDVAVYILKQRDRQNSIDNDGH